MAEMNERPCDSDPRFKWFECELPWTTRNEWMMPVNEEMHKASVPDAMTFVKAAMRHQPEDRRGVCIQAGGLFGLWPLAYSRFFENVFTFEPHPENWKCLCTNVFGEGYPNICPVNQGLGSEPGQATMEYSKPQRNSYGAHWTKEAKQGTVVVDTIDNFVKNTHILQVDHIQLDIEGSELEALRGAQATIRRDYPVVVIEHRTLPHMHKESINPAGATKWLIREGYRIASIVGYDRIFTHEQT